MKKNLIQEVYRIREIMGLTIISEGGIIKSLGELLIDVAEKSSPLINFNTLKSKVDELINAYQKALEEMKLKRNIVENDNYLDALDEAFGVGNVVGQAKFLSDLKRGIASKEDIEKFVNAITKRQFDTSWRDDVVKQFMRENGASDLVDYADDPDWSIAFRSFNEGGDSVITQSHIDGFATRIRSVRDSFAPDSEIYKEYNKLFEKVTGRSLDDPSKILDETVISPTIDDLTNELSGLRRQKYAKTPINVINKKLDELTEKIKNSKLTDLEKDDLIKQVQKLKGETPKYDGTINGFRNLLKNDLVDFIGSGWYNMMKKVENKLGAQYPPYTPEQLQKVRQILEYLASSRSKNGKIYFTNLSEGKLVLNTPDEIINIIESGKYNVIMNPDGTLSLINRLDTHRKDSIETFIKWIERKQNKNEIFNEIGNELSSETQSKVALDKYLDELSKDDAFWKELQENEMTMLPNIQRTKYEGQLLEDELTTDESIKKLFEGQWSLFWKGGDGDILDRGLSIDFVIKNNDTGELKTVQVKKVQKIEVVEVNQKQYLEITGQKIYVAKQSQIDFAIFSDSNGNKALTNGEITPISKQGEEYVETITNKKTLNPDKEGVYRVKKEEFTTQGPDSETIYIIGKKQ